MSDDPTLGEIYWGGYVDKAAILNFPYSDLDQEAIDAIEAGAAAAGAAAIARLDQGEPQPAPELAAAMAETRELRQLVAEIIGEFSPTGSGLYARVGQIQIGKWCKRAGMPT